MYEYDVFLSFSSKDEKLIRPVWQRLVGSGLKVFFSDETMKAKLSRSFLAEIQEALVASRSFLLLASDNALASDYVTQEYEAFYNHCFIRNQQERYFLILPLAGYDLDALPVFLKNLQHGESLEQVIEFLGGLDPEKLKRKIAALEAENSVLKQQLSALQGAGESADQKLILENATLKRQLRQLLQAGTEEEASWQERFNASLQKARDRIKPEPGRPEGNQQPGTGLRDGDQEPGEPLPPDELAPPVPGQPGRQEAGSPDGHLKHLSLVHGDKEALQVVEASCREIPLRLSRRSWSGGYESLTAAPAAALHKRLAGREIRILAYHLYEFKKEPVEIWKCLLLLRHCILRPSNRNRSELVLELLLHLLENPLLKPVRDTAIKLIYDLPAPASRKWETLFRALQVVIPVDTQHIIEYLQKITPSARREETAALVLEIIQSVNVEALTIAGLNLLAQFDYRPAASCLRELLQYNQTSVTTKAVTLLARWNDREAAPLILDSLEMADGTYFGYHLSALQELGSVEALLPRLEALASQATETKARAVREFLENWKRKHR